mmetsp:Transcript_8739/g.13039  ORF Transcript_8739/g.13039 Transcript_8739/m.13039 type:complete len:292 (-) Transcript_8739:435-1310(-)
MGGLVGRRPPLQVRGRVAVEPGQVRIGHRHTHLRHAAAARAPEDAQATGELRQHVVEEQSRPLSAAWEAPRHSEASLAGLTEGTHFPGRTRPAAAGAPWPAGPLPHPAPAQTALFSAATPRTADGGLLASAPSEPCRLCAPATAAPSACAEPAGASHSQRGWEARTVCNHEVLRCVYRGQVHPVGRPVHDESARIVGQHGQHVELLRPPFIFLQFGTAFFIVMRQYHSHSQPIRFLGLSEDLFDQRHMNYHSFHGLQPHGFIDGNREHIYLKIVIIHHEFRRNINCIGFII